VNCSRLSTDTKTLSGLSLGLSAVETAKPESCTPLTPTKCQCQGELLPFSTRYHAIIMIACRFVLLPFRPLILRRLRDDFVRDLQANCTQSNCKTRRRSRVARKVRLLCDGISAEKTREGLRGAATRIPEAQSGEHQNHVKLLNSSRALHSQHCGSRLCQEAVTMKAFHGHDDDFLYEYQKEPQRSPILRRAAHSRRLHNLLRPIRSAIWQARWIIRRIIEDRR
jgi:hypothetical protein